MFPTEEEFRRPIIKNGTRILRPKEFRALLNGCQKMDYKIILQTMLYTGMRYVEMQRFQVHREWFDGDFVHLPKEACLKKARTQQERWVRLNNQGKMIVQFFQNINTHVPTTQSWGMNLKSWAEKVGLSPEGLSVKTTRKTWESWLLFFYPEYIAMITLSQGHTQIISLQHYLNIPFTEADRVEIKSFVEGWAPDRKG